MNALALLSTAALVLTLSLSTIVGLLTPYITAAILLVIWLVLLVRGRLPTAYADDLSRWFLAVFVGLFLLFVLSMQTWRDPLSAINFGMLLLAGPAVWLFARLPVQVKPIHISLLAALGLAITVIFLAVQLGDAGRPLMINLGPIRASNAALALAVVASTGALISKDRRSLLLLLSLGAALAIVIMSQSRGPLLAVVPLLALTAFAVWRVRMPSFGWRAIVAFLVVFGLTLLAIQFLGGRRLVRLPSVVMALLSGEGDVDHSVRTRLAFYAAGWKAFLQSPWIGHGWANMMSAAAAVADAEFLAQARGHRHLHNDLIDFAVSGGVVGVVLYAVIIAAPVVAAWRSVGDQLRRARLYAATGISAVYVFGGMTDLMFGQEFQGALFVMLHAIVITGIRARPNHDPQGSV